MAEKGFTAVVRVSIPFNFVGVYEIFFLLALGKLN
jgi:hypothetical protein